jgi:hypothetical protein
LRAGGRTQEEASPQDEQEEDASAASQERIDAHWCSSVVWDVDCGLFVLRLVIAQLLFPPLIHWMIPCPTHRLSSEECLLPARRPPIIRSLEKRKRGFSAIRPSERGLAAVEPAINAARISRRNPAICAFSVKKILAQT